MSLTCRSIKILTLVLLAVQLCLPVSGPAFFSEYLRSSEAGHAGVGCAHTDADSGHESQDDREQISHCHELDAPCDMASAPLLEYSPVIAILTATDKGDLLSGYGASIDKPPESSLK